MTVLREVFKLARALMDGQPIFITFAWAIQKDRLFFSTKYHSQLVRKPKRYDLPKFQHRVFISSEISCFTFFCTRTTMIFIPLIIPASIGQKVEQPPGVVFILLDQPKANFNAFRTIITAAFINNFSLCRCHVKGSSVRTMG